MKEVDANSEYTHIFPVIEFDGRKFGASTHDEVDLMREIYELRSKLAEKNDKLRKANDKLRTFKVFDKRYGYNRVKDEFRIEDAEGVNVVSSWIMFQELCLKIGDLTSLVERMKYELANPVEDN